MNIYRVSKYLQYLVLEERGIIPRLSGTKFILNVANLMKRGI